MHSLAELLQSFADIPFNDNFLSHNIDDGLCIESGRPVCLIHLVRRNRRFKLERARNGQDAYRSVIIAFEGLGELTHSSSISLRRSSSAAMSSMMDCVASLSKYLSKFDYRSAGGLARGLCTITSVVAPSDVGASQIESSSEVTTP